MVVFMVVAFVVFGIVSLVVAVTVSPVWQCERLLLFQ